MKNANKLQGLRQAVEQMADAGSPLEEIESLLVDSTSGLDAERRAVLWLYARACTDAARGQPEFADRPRSDAGRVHASGRPSEPATRAERGRGRMPYVRCPNCGLTTYTTRDRARAAECPGCGEPLWSGGDAGREAARSGIEAPSGEVVAGALELARDELDMDVALLTEIAGGRESVSAAAGEWPTLGSLRGVSAELEETFCNQLLEGRISNYVRDASEDDRVRELGMARELGIRAWIGVPLRLSDARLYMLCCLAREERLALGDAEVRFLSGLAESVRVELEGAASG